MLMHKDFVHELEATANGGVFNGRPMTSMKGRATIVEHPNFEEAAARVFGRGIETTLLRVDFQPPFTKTLLELVRTPL